MNRPTAYSYSRATYRLSLEISIGAASAWPLPRAPPSPSPRAPPAPRGTHVYQSTVGERARARDLAIFALSISRGGGGGECLPACLLACLPVPHAAAAACAPLHAAFSKG